MHTTRYIRPDANEITPVAILLLLRASTAPTPLDALLAQLGLSAETSAYHQERRRFAQVMLGLERIGFVERISTGELELTESVLADPWWRHRPEMAELSWRVLPHAHQVLQALEISLTDVAHNQRSRHVEELQRLETAANELNSVTLLEGNRVDLVASIHELARCLHGGCYIAVMALAGKVLEIVVKNRLWRLGAKFPDDWMLGKLIGELVAMHDDVFCDSAMKNVINVINLSRVSAVHSKSEVPIPSEDQAIMVVRATLDVLARFLATVD